MNMIIIILNIFVCHLNDYTNTITKISEIYQKNILKNISDLQKISRFFI